MTTNQLKDTVATWLRLIGEMQDDTTLPTPIRVAALDAEIGIRRLQLALKINDAINADVRYGIYNLTSSRWYSYGGVDSVYDSQLEAGRQCALLSRGCAGKFEVREYPGK